MTGLKYIYILQQLYFINDGHTEKTGNNNQESKIKIMTFQNRDVTSSRDYIEKKIKKNLKNLQNPKSK